MATTIPVLPVEARLALQRLHEAYWIIDDAARYTANDRALDAADRKLIEARALLREALIAIRTTTEESR